MKGMMLVAFGIMWAFIAQAQGPQWNEITTPVKASLRGLSPVSDKICWASGSNGTWLKTMDGGLTWEHGVIAGLDTVDFRSIQAFDQNTAVAASAGQPAVIYRTVDGGRSWSKAHQEEAEAAFFDGISFSNRKNGYVIGDPVEGKWMILETEDGGKTWQSLTNLPDAEIGEAAFAASASSLIADKTGLIFGTGGPVSNLHFYRFKDWTWTKVKTPILQGEPSQGIFAIASTEAGLVAVGGDYTKLEDREKHAFIYNDGSFEYPIAMPLGYRSGLAYWKKKNLTIAVGPSGSDFSTDGGKSWNDFSPTGYHAVKTSPDQKAIWASGSGGRIGILIP
ncbi:YCF48-related protein [Algoriphagus jejuensis]|uniref:YCF48-related protein n=1 Tax=Algoriphagus jejuensis TaxID=419934 RepID=A0ABP3YB02_9BACT